MANITGPAAGDVAAPDLGDSDADLVFTKLTPCRVADTRVAGGALANASQRNFYVADGATPGSYTAQGGVPCGVPFGATSAAVNITVTQAAGSGWLRAWPYGSSGTASIINYAVGNTLANGLILPICDPAAANCDGGDLTVRADAAGTHVLIDVMGYFLKVDKANYRSVTTTHTRSGSSLLLSESCANFTTVQVVAPGPGEVVITGTALVAVDHLTGYADNIDWGIQTSATQCTFTMSQDGMRFWLSPSAPTSSYKDYGTITARFAIPAAGTYTYYLNGRCDPQNPDLEAQRVLGAGTLTATFHPQ